MLGRVKIIEWLGKSLLGLSSSLRTLQLQLPWWKDPVLYLKAVVGKEFFFGTVLTVFFNFAKVSYFWRCFFLHHIFMGKTIERLKINVSLNFSVCTKKLISIRGRSQTTFTRFGFLWPPTPLRLHFLQNKSLQKVDFFDHLPPSSRKCSLWTAPKSE